jgi:hypothetical protein
MRRTVANALRWRKAESEFWESVVYCVAGAVTANLTIVGRFNHGLTSVGEQRLKRTDLKIF